MAGCSTTTISRVRTSRGDREASGEEIVGTAATVGSVEIGDIVEEASSVEDEGSAMMRSRRYPVEATVAATVAAE